MAKKAKPTKYRYVAHVVIETSREVPRKRVREALMAELDVPGNGPLLALGNGVLGEVKTVRANVDHD